jgi:hypothetical protein
MPSMVSGVESAKLKVSRVAKHLNEISVVLRDYVRSEADSISESKSSGKLNFVGLPPDDIPIVAGEIVYQLRSSLDHLAFDLVQLNSMGITLPNRWDEHCKFPLLLDVPIKGNPPIPVHTPLAYNFFKDTLPGISTQAFEFIESVQPYNDGDIALGLRYIAELSNIDKHRHPHITKPHAIRRDENTVRYRGNTFLGSSQVRLDAGAEVKPMSDPEVEIISVEVDRDLTPFVSFDESALGLNAPNLAVEDVLQSALDAVELGVIPAFTEFLKKP